MSFLLHYNNSFSLVDNNSKYGIFCQMYNQTGVSRPALLQALNNTDYSASMDESGKLHIVTMPTHYQLTYFCYENSHYSKRTIAESTTETYNFSNPIIHASNAEINVFYLSNKALSNTYAIVRQTLITPLSETLFESNHLIESLKSFIYDNTIYIFFILQNTDYFLKCLKISASGIQELTLLHSKMPISDYCICPSEDFLDIAYVTELHGKYQLSYYNTRTSQPKILCNTLFSSAPVIFWYYDYLWINFYDDNKLYILLSIDNGNSFSSPVLCSIQNSLRRCTFTTNKNSSLRCTELYVSISSSNVHVSTLFTIDFEHLHPDSKIPIELELLLEGLTLSHRDCSRAEQLSEEVTALREENKNLKLKYEQLLLKTPGAKPGDEPVTSSVKSAANAFMEELPTWDAPPRL